MQRSSIFSFGFEQRQRLISLNFPHDDAPRVTDVVGRECEVRLVIDRLEADEALSRDFRFTLHLLADSARLKLKDMLGKLLVVSLVRPDGSLRHFSGYCFEFTLDKADDGVAHYTAVLRPWLHHLTLRSNNRVFLGQTLQQQTGTIFADYGALPQWQWLSVPEDPQITMACQGGGSGETDANFLHARWEAMGLSYHYEHDQNGHTLVITGDTTIGPAIEGATPEIRFHAAGGSAEEDAIQSWSPARAGISAAYSAVGFDFKNPRPVQAATITHHQPGEVPRLEIHEYAGAYGLRVTAGREYVELRADELDAVAKVHEAESNNHQVQPGRWFQLVDHFSAGDRNSNDSKYLIVSAIHTATNNYLQQRDEPAAYSNTFVASRRHVTWRPGRGFNSTRVQVLAPQTATVAGPEGSGSLNVDEYGRIQVVFHWDREGRHSARVRVSTGWAGGETGAVSHPRVGSEVVLQFLDGNPDHPLVTGVVYNAWRMPPWHLPDQKALTGLRSRELQGDSGNSPGGRSNHVLLDDTEGKIQAQLRSDHDASQLSLGHITRIERTAGRQDARGQGFELRTDGHGAMRAARGMLITTEARANAQAHTTDMGETIARLTAGRDQHESLADTALQAKAQEGGDQDEVAKALKDQNDQVKGGNSPNAGKREQGEFPELSDAHLVLASPAGIEATTAGSTHLASAEHHAVTSGAHASVSAGKSFLVTAREAVRLFACKAGMKLVAASSDIDITALKNSIHLLAKLDITHTANKITITAKEEVVINGGTSYTRWNATGIESGTNGIWREHAAVHSLVGPANLPMQAPRFPEAVCKECMEKAAARAAAVAPRQ